MSEQKWTKEIQAKIIARAWKDEAFKKKLLENPKEALKEFDVEWRGTIILTALEETSNQFYFVLPQSPAQISKLSETELENLAAAKHTHTDICSICGCAG